MSMSDMPEIAGRAPLPVEVEAGKSYWWCACGRSKCAAVLRRLAQGQRLLADRVQGDREHQGLLLRLQAQRKEAAVRRQP